MPVLAAAAIIIPPADSAPARPCSLAAADLAKETSCLSKKARRNKRVTINGFVWVPPTNETALEVALTHTVRGGTPGPAWPLGGPLGAGEHEAHAGRPRPSMGNSHCLPPAQQASLRGGVYHPAP